MKIERFRHFRTFFASVYTILFQSIVKNFIRCTIYQFYVLEAGSVLITYLIHSLQISHNFLMHLAYKHLIRN